MNKRQVIILWAIAILLAVAVPAVKLGRVKETKSVTARTAGQTLLASFPASDVATIEIKGANATTHLAKKDGKWVITDRDDFPANPVTVNGLLRVIGELKITQGMQAGPSFAPRFGMDESSKIPTERGITTVYKDASGKEIATVTIGKRIESSAADPQAGASGNGHFVRNHADESGFYAVSDSFASLSDWPQRWLPEEFITVDKIQSVSVTEPGKSDIAWKVVRADANADFALEGQAASEAIEPATATALKSLFANPLYEDVVPAGEIEKRSLPEEKRIVTLVTFDGLTYKITIIPNKPGSAPALVDPQNPSPTSDDAFLVNIEVSGELSKERQKPADEKPEDAKKADEAFAASRKALEEKIAKEKAMTGYTYQLARPAVETFLKTRAELTKKPEAAGGPGNRLQNPTFRIPEGGVTATTAPVEAVMPARPPAQEPKEEKPTE